MSSKAATAAKTPKQKSALWRIIKDYVSHHKVAFSISFICIVISAFGNIAAPLVLQEITSLLTSASVGGVIPESMAGELQGEVVHYVVLLACVYGVAIASMFTYSQLTAIAGQKYMNELRKKLFEHMEDLPIRYFDEHDKGNIMSVYLNDVDTVRQLIGQSIPTAIMSGTCFIAVFVTMILESVYLTLFIVLALVIMLIASKHIGGKSSRNFVAQQQMIGRQEGYVEEMMSGLKVIKSFCHEEECEVNFDEINEELRQVSTAANQYGNSMGPTMGNIGNLTYVLVAVVGSLFAYFEIPNLSVLYGTAPISISIIVSFLPMVKNITNNTNQIAEQVNSIAMAAGGSRRVCNLLDREKEVDDGYITLVRGKYDENGNIVEVNTKDETQFWAWKNPHHEGDQSEYRLLKGDIVLDDVDFGYNPDKIVLHNISLYAHPGQKVAFVGATGAGKTTITNLLNRFYDIADGRIRYDGININKIKKADLRRSLGMVLQDTSLFSGTIMDNIRYGRLDATDEECIEAAKLANADSFITRLPDGYNTMLSNDGGNLSQGQRQLLSIARAAVNDSPVLILDEATSSIDTRTEALVTKGMDNLMEGRTVFVIAHRLSTIQNSDVIMVLDHGRIIERGSHDELIAMQGTYYQLYTGAFELE